MKRRDLIFGAVAAGAGGVAGFAHAAQSVKCVIVGDPLVGKTWALSSFAQHSTPATYVPTVISAPYTVQVTLVGQPLQVSLQDTSGDEGYSTLRPVVYPQTDIFIAAYAIDSMSSMDNVTVKWVPEIRFHNPDARIVLAGLKSDLRAGMSSSPVSREAAKDVSERLALQAYRECSATTRIGLDDLFATALGVAVGRASTPLGSLQRTPIGRRPMRRPGN
ncbi:MAG: GTP-binding protein [Hyphomonadaceae bacterium]|nr:GTP-binding protein [Hyphomonadaceae bacterium]